MDDVNQSAASASNLNESQGVGSAAGTIAAQTEAQEYRPTEEEQAQIEAQRAARSKAYAQENEKRLDDALKGWLRKNIRWVMAEWDHTKNGHSEDARAILNP